MKMQISEINQSIRHLFVVIFQQLVVENFNNGGDFLPLQQRHL